MEENILKLLEKGKLKNESSKGSSTYFRFNFEKEHDFYCNECLANRRMNVKNINFNPHSLISYENNLIKAIELLYPLIYELTCLQCKSKAHLIIYKNENEFKSIILYEKAGGCSSKNAPDGVKYYLNQAYQSRMIGAQSASMSMYRAAIDFILFNQGYTTGMLGKKIEKLEKDILEKNAPKWAMEIPIDYIKVIKEIGNSSIHPNDGNIDKQREIDEKLLNIIDIIFIELLDKIYEQPIRSANHLNILKSKIDLLNS